MLSFVLMIASGGSRLICPRARPIRCQIYHEYWVYASTGAGAAIVMPVLPRTFSSAIVWLHTPRCM